MELQKHFSEVADYRFKGRYLQSLSEILVIILCRTLVDDSDFAEIKDETKDKLVFFREKLGLSLNYLIHSTVKRVSFP